MLIEEIVTNIDARIAALKSEIQPLIDAQAALLGAAPTPARQKRPLGKSTPAPVAPEPNVKAETPAAAPKRAPRKRTPKRSADPVPAGKLIALLQASDGAAAVALAKAAGGSVEQVRVLLKEMAEQGHVRRSGARRSTRWHLVTDEHRIAARVAELEVRSKGNAGAAAEPVAAGVAD
jgi:hypothetical protein